MTGSAAALVSFGSARASCGQASLAYVYSRQGSDVYRCAMDRGGCERTVKHRRMTGSDACGIVIAVKGAQLGQWQPCKLAAKGSVEKQ